MQIRFPDHDCPSIFELSDHLSVFARHTIVENFASGCCAYACSINVVFQRDRNPVQGAAESVRLDLGIHLCGLGERLITHDGDVCIELRIVDLDSVQQSLG